MPLAAPWMELEPSHKGNYVQKRKPPKLHDTAPSSRGEYVPQTNLCSGKDMPLGQEMGVAKGEGEAVGRTGIRG